MRIVLAAALALVVAGCGRPPAQADNTDVAAVPAEQDTGAIDNQTLEQVLDRTMNRFARLDLNGDGKLTQDELNAATEGGDQTENIVARPRDGRSARAFARDDANGDGTVTRAEAESAARDRFKALDANADGKLSKDEAAGADLKPKARPANGR